jgi:hypothetical protein
VRKRREKGRGQKKKTVTNRERKTDRWTDKQKDR